MRSKSKSINFRLIIIIPLIFFGISILTAILTYYLTLYYVKTPNILHLNDFIDKNEMYRLQFFILCTALFSFLCGFLVTYSIINPINKLLNQAITISRNKNNEINYIEKGLFVKKNEIEQFSSVFEDVLKLLKSYLREEELKKVRPLLDRVKKADHFAALGFLSAKMAHEIRNPLGSISGLVQLIEKDLKKNDPIKTYIQQILKSIGKINKIVENLLEFASPCSFEKEITDINNILKEAIFQLAFEFKDKEILVREEYQEDLPKILSDSQKLQQAFLNIIKNAFQFIDNKGSILIKTIYKRKNRISVSISNTGSYLSPKEREMIFVPFYTTKKQGVGLGLCIANDVISSLNGRIRVESDKSHGTTFILELPIGDDVLEK